MSQITKVLSVHGIEVEGTADVGTILGARRVSRKNFASSGAQEKHSLK